MIKRQTALLAVAATVAALGLAGCGGGGDSGSGGKTKVVVWDGYEDAQGKNLTALIAQYNKENPDVEVTQLVSSSDRRSEERRVGKECRSRWAAQQEKEDRQRR